MQLVRLIFRQTRAYHLKKKKEEERNAIPYKKKQPFIHGTKETKKKKSKTLKPKTSFPIKIHTRSDYKFFSVPSNTQIGLACSTLSQYG